jgi:hypothetical protein
MAETRQITIAMLREAAAALPRPVGLVMHWADYERLLPLVSVRRADERWPDYGGIAVRFVEDAAGGQ